MKSAPLREGFLDFLGDLKRRKIPLIVVTGGLEDFVRETLRASIRDVHSVYGLKVNTDGPFLRVCSEWESRTELVSKPRILEWAGKRMCANPPVLIGDSVTDLEAALTCPVVFARDRLARYLTDRKKDYVPFEDFIEIRKAFTEMFPVDA
jgi:2-hydroxy-3-keto-5-methylthiopentenyl-1-phosphate phosphatase